MSCLRAVCGESLMHKARGLTEAVNALKPGYVATQALREGQRALLGAKGARRVSACTPPCAHLGEVGQRALLEAERDTLALNILLPHAAHHLGDVDEGALGAAGHHLDDVVLRSQSGQSSTSPSSSSHSSSCMKCWRHSLAKLGRALHGPACHHPVAHAFKVVRVAGTWSTSLA